MTRQMIRHLAVLVVGVAAVSGTGGSAPAEASHLEVVETSGLGGFVASATGYTTPDPHSLACLGHEPSSCPVAGLQLPISIPAEVEGLVAGSVNP